MPATAFPERVLLLRDSSGDIRFVSPCRGEDGKSFGKQESQSSWYAKDDWVRWRRDSRSVVAAHVL